MISNLNSTGKQWGNPEGAPVLCLHGWLDNSCSFDGLAPLLPNDTHNFLAIDLPGHGFSDHFPPGMVYRFSDTFTALQYVQEHMKWDKFTLMGHSLGAAISIWYSAIFPELIDRFIAIDLVQIGPVTLKKHSSQTKKAILTGVKTFNALEKAKGVPPTYDRIDAVARAFMANQFAHGQDSITQESVETLMKRGLRPVGDKWTWTADLRLRIPATFSALEEQVEHYSTQIKSPMLFIKATGSGYYMQEEVAKRVVKTFINHNPNFEMHKVEGGHHVHLNHPDRVSDLINEFLLKTEFLTEDDDKKEKQENFPLDLF